MSAAAPDYAEAVLGWRAWSVADAGQVRLRGVVHPSEWPAGRPHEAACAHSPLPHPAPWPGCRCGLHAARAPGEAAYYADVPSRNAQIVAVGRVLLWGRVVEGARGWRGSHGYPERLHLPLRRRADLGRLREAAWGLTEYGVPVGILDCTERGVLDALALAVPGSRGPLPAPLPVAG